MKRHLALAAMALAVGAGTVREAKALLGLQVTEEPINSVLAANGWEGLKLSLVAAPHPNGGAIPLGELPLSMDWQNLTYPTNDWPANVPIPPNLISPQGLIAPWGNKTPGLTGPTHQAWTILKTGMELPTAFGPMPPLTGSAADSTFISLSNYILPPNPYTEDNNQANGSGFEASPLADVPYNTVTHALGVDYGVGSVMTFVEAIPYYAAAPTLDFAFIIVPRGTGDVSLRGVGLDDSGNMYGWDVVLNPASGISSDALMPLFASVPLPTPEPATAAALGSAGLLALLKRRKTR